MALPFSILDTWINEFRRFLLLELRENYTEQLIGEIENDRYNPEDVKFSLFDEVFNSLQNAGEDDRPIMWAQLTRMVASKPTSMVEYAACYAEKLYESANKNSLLKFILEALDRLAAHITGDEWAIDEWEQMGELIIQVAHNRPDVLNEEACSKVADLSESYFNEELESNHPTKLLDALLLKQSNESERVLSLMISKLFEGLPAPSVQWLAKNFL